MRRLLLVSGLLLAVSSARADSQFGAGGLGVGISPTNVRGWALGGLAVALDDTLRLSLANPAAPAGYRRVSMSAVYLADRREAADETGEAFFTTSGIPLFEFLIPFGSRFALGFGYDVDEDLGTARTRVPFLPGEDPVVPHTRYFERSGALFRVPAAFCFRLFDDLRIGFRIDNYFLNVEETYDLDFDDPSIRSARERLRVGCSGAGATVGILVPFRERLTAGFVYTSPATLDGDRERVGASGSKGIDPIEVGTPERIAAGVSLRLGEGWTVGAEAALASWEEVGDTIAALGGYRDVVSYAVGVERAPGRDDPSFLRLPIRAGFRVDPLSYRSEGGEEIARWMATIGSGVPLGGGRGTLDFGVEYGTIGDRESVGLEETYLRFLIGFTGQEPWKRRKSYIE
ncbi:MAG: hypothetical protein ABIH26_01740 [Candidatus Eisenbacteria bacterium]